MTAPLAQFGRDRMLADNKLFTEWENFPFIVGQRVYGTWVDVDGRTYFTEGEIDYNDKSGFWVVDANGSITPVKLFWTMFLNL